MASFYDKNTSRDLLCGFIGCQYKFNFYKQSETLVTCPQDPTFIWISSLRMPFEEVIWSYGLGIWTSIMGILICCIVVLNQRLWGLDPFRKGMERHQTGYWYIILILNFEVMCMWWSFNSGWISWMVCYFKFVLIWCTWGLIALGPERQDDSNDKITMDLVSVCSTVCLG